MDAPSSHRAGRPALGAAEALKNTIDLARHADELGLHRFWLGEIPTLARSRAECTATSALYAIEVARVDSSLDRRS